MKVTPIGGPPQKPSLLLSKTNTFDSRIGGPTQNHHFYEAKPTLLIPVATLYCFPNHVSMLFQKNRFHMFLLSKTHGFGTRCYPQSCQILPRSSRHTSFCFGKSTLFLREPQRRSKLPVGVALEPQRHSKWLLEVSPAPQWRSKWLLALASETPKR